MDKEILIKGLYDIKAFDINEDIITASVWLNKDHEVFEGHFPGNPIMPGVCMMQMIKELTEKAIDRELFLSVASNVKFMAIINPEKNDTIHLILNINQVDDQVKVKTTVSFEETLALKLNATFKISA
ncbi:3-hydroxyacyl-ACP dehydratase [Pseudozobellia thermophila]|uniref:3-hydroxyacyl-[acyl-carrier-protein] dehydratase n=1 Tax=Pseudozobellia thermophila TaxID=192903 RepID=A0A1M6CJT3_9FLAO|nr:3-hydroxyacyl-ACP dehydratase [Pseudozobellia thermophila]SHI61285.1 3-hydroxyacyl-[acyl-carrier-protein] dehydratase [Pseudozobellia thermophila]